MFCVIVRQYCFEAIVLEVADKRFTVFIFHEHLINLWLVLKVGSIEGRVGVHHVDDSNQSKNFTFKCHREGTDIFSVNSLNFHPVR